MAQIEEDRSEKIEERKRQFTLRLELESPPVDLEDFGNEIDEVGRHLESSLNWFNEEARLLQPDYSGWRVRKVSIVGSDDLQERSAMK